MNNMNFIYQSQGLFLHSSTPTFIGSYFRSTLDLLYIHFISTLDPFYMTTQRQ